MFRGLRVGLMIVICDELMTMFIAAVRNTEDIFQCIAFLQNFQRDMGFVEVIAGYKNSTNFRQKFLTAYSFNCKNFSLLSLHYYNTF